MGAKGEPREAPTQSAQLTLKHRDISREVDDPHAQTNAQREADTLYTQIAIIFCPKKDTCLV